MQPQVAQSFWAGLTSWRSMLPRQAHDELAMIFLRHGGQLHILRTNQIGGWQSQIMPLAPTGLFGSDSLDFLFWRYGQAVWEEK